MEGGKGGGDASVKQSGAYTACGIILNNSRDERSINSFGKLVIAPIISCCMLLRGYEAFRKEGRPCFPVYFGQCNR